MTVAVINGSVGGASGNTAAALARLPFADADRIVLADYAGSVEALAERLTRATSFVVGTGVYWGSWGSPLQRFLEVMTSYEASPLFLGKPVGFVVTMDSVGGEVAQRLAGVFSTLGCVIPPFSTVVLSRVAHEAKALPGNDDVWQLEDLAVLAHNVTHSDYKAWSISKAREVHGTYPHAGVLDLGLPKFAR